MYFDLTDEQQQIKTTAKEFLASRYKSERVRELAASERGFADSDYAEMAELGWAGLALPEEWGGQGLGIVDLAVLFEELGYALAPSPLLSSTLAGLSLEAGGTDDQKERYLRPLAEGSIRGTVALYDPGAGAGFGNWKMESTSDGDGVVLNGEKVLVIDADTADFLIVATSDGRTHLVDTGAEGVTITAEESIDTTRHLCSVRFDRVKIGVGETLSGDGSVYDPVFGRACVMLAAELTGIAQRTMEMAVGYARERQQFGRPIGAYQAVSHLCAGMLLETENSRSAVYYAAWTADDEPGSLNLAGSMAKAQASDAGWRVAADSIQVHGGIGFTWEHDLHFFLKRAKADAGLFGDPHWHREHIARLILPA